jgi:hypothetical protein
MVIVVWANEAADAAIRADVKRYCMAFMTVVRFVVIGKLKVSISANRFPALFDGKMSECPVEVARIPKFFRAQKSPRLGGL